MKTKTSDLSVRFASAVVMIAVAVAALWLGGLWLDGFVIIVAAATFVEFLLLVYKAIQGNVYRLAAIVAGLLYIGLGASFLVRVSGDAVFSIILAVIGVDSLAYFAGRTFGGPKIAPSISPSKTWSGLIGGMAGAAVGLIAGNRLFATFYETPLCQRYYNFLDSFGPQLSPGAVAFDDRCHFAVSALDSATIWRALWAGALIAVIAQAGDFFESWLKRRAGVKDSSSLIPGHGGVFDRVDGLLAVSFVLCLVQWGMMAVYGSSY